MHLQTICIFYFVVHLCVEQSESGTLDIVSDLLPEDCFNDMLNYIDDSEFGTPICSSDFGSAKDCNKVFKPPSNYKILPTNCAKDGYFGAKQCKGDHLTGRCFCYDKDATKLFGQQWWNQAENMTCACSRRKAEMGNSVFYNSLHCDRMGNYEPLQCDMVSEQCWCADDRTGDLLSPVVPMKAMTHLPCYRSNTVGVQYLRQCDQKKYAQENILHKLSLHGSSKFSFGDFLCDGDGAYGSYTVIDGSAYCTWRDNSKIRTFQSSEDRQQLNCNCARDVMYFEEVGKTQLRKCEGGGNYQELQTILNVKICVDIDGYSKSEENPDKECGDYDVYD